jgi:hypothetical protein
MTLSIHALQRAKQRGIPPIIIQWLEEFGEQTYDHNGAVILYFTKKSRRRLERAVGREVTRRVSEWLDSYAVQSLDGKLITIGHRYQRIYN